jgi:two-component system sensor histidine kinase BaeS
LGHKLQQLAGNLIDNAVKFTPSGGKVTVSLSETRDNVVFKVADSGVGIANGDLPKIYDRFYRAERSRGTPGSGLGLSLVRAVVTFYGGDIDCKSKPGSGTVFTVTLPKRKRQV